MCANMFAVAVAPLVRACAAVSRADLRKFPSQFFEISVPLRRVLMKVPVSSNEVVSKVLRSCQQRFVSLSCTFVGADVACSASCRSRRVSRGSHRLSPARCSSAW